MVLHSKRKEVFIFYSYGKIRPSSHFFPEMFWAGIIPIKYVCVYIRTQHTYISLYICQQDRTEVLPLQQKNLSKYMPYCLKRRITAVESLPPWEICRPVAAVTFQRKAEEMKKTLWSPSEAVCIRVEVVGCMVQSYTLGVNCTTFQLSLEHT